MAKVSAAKFVDGLLDNFNQIGELTKLVESGAYASLPPAEGQVFNKQLSSHLRGLRAMRVSVTGEALMDFNPMGNKPLPLQARRRLAEFVAERAADPQEDINVRLVAVVTLENMATKQFAELFTAKSARLIGQLAQDQAFLQPITSSGEVFDLPERVATVRPGLKPLMTPKAG